MKGEVLRRVAVHDNQNLHVAAMGFWATYFVKDDNVKKCGKMPKDIRSSTGRRSSTALPTTSWWCPS